MVMVIWYLSLAAARLVGPKGRVIGVDMTTSQLAVAQRYLDWHMERLEYQTPNVTFVKGFIEDLATAGIQVPYSYIVLTMRIVTLTGWTLTTPHVPPSHCQWCLS